MAWYAQRPTKLIRQVVADACLLVWTIVWFVIGRTVDGVIRAFAAPARSTADRATAAAEQFRSSSEQAGSVPAIGGGLARPFEQAASTMDSIASSARDLASTLELVATLAGLGVFLLPFLLALALWLPRRLAYHRRTRSARDLAETESGLDLLALRALATQPVHQLRQVTSDPVQAWRDGDLPAVNALAEVELRSLGLRRRPGVADEARTTVPVGPPVTTVTPDLPETPSSPTPDGDQR